MYYFSTFEFFVRMRREDVSVNLNGMLERVIWGLLTVSDTISVVVCGQKLRS